MGVLRGLQEWLWGASGIGHGDVAGLTVTGGAAGLGFGGNPKVSRSSRVLSVCAPPGED